MHSFIIDFLDLLDRASLDFSRDGGTMNAYPVCNLSYRMTISQPSLNLTSLTRCQVRIRTFCDTIGSRHAYLSFYTYSVATFSISDRHVFCVALQFITGVFC